VGAPPAGKIDQQGFDLARNELGHRFTVAPDEKPAKGKNL
jgi:hypothetical protein